MLSAEINHEDFLPQNQQAGDEKLLVKFYIKPRQDPRATAEQGHPVFKDVEYIDIKIPGSRTGGATRPASERDKARFPRHYAAFKQRTEAPNEGTPLIEWPMITRSQAEELAFHNVKTVEQLIGMSDANAMKFMGMNALREKAKKWLEVSEGAATANAIAERDERIATLEAQVEQLLARQPAVAPEPEPELSSELDEPSKPKPRRKRRAKRVVDEDAKV